MQHAVLITAYKSVHHLRSMMDALDDRFRFYIHYDRDAMDRDAEEELDKLVDHASFAEYSCKYKVNWAGCNHLRAMILLLERAVADPKTKVFHMLSGQDFPIKPPGEIIRFFEINPEKQFIEHFPMPAGHWSNGGMHRTWYWYFYDLIDYKTRPGYFINRAAIRLQKIFGIKRKWPGNLPPLHGGGGWWSITRECAEYVIEYGRNHPELLRRFRFALCPEEMYFQTIIMNSPYAAQAVSNHLRYIDWTKRNGNSPANLDESDFEILVKSDKLFARKFEYPVSAELLRKITAAKI